MTTDRSSAPRKVNLTASIGKNTLFGITASLVQVATRLVTVPIAIGHLGLDGYGIWSIIMLTSAYMRFGSVGIKNALQKYVAEATATGDFERTNRLLSTGTAVMLVLSVVGLIPVAIFSSRLAAAMGVPQQFIEPTAGAIVLLAIVMGLSNVCAAYEAIVNGALRIDLTRKFTTVFTVLEAIAIVALLIKGHGLVAMAAVMAVSEIGFLVCCYLAARRVLPTVHVIPRYVTRTVLREFFIFAGSYQLVSILEVVYTAVLPVTVLKYFGADAAGVYAVAIRLVAAALMLQDAFLVPVLSGGSMVFAEGSKERIESFLAKTFKTTLALTMLPLALVALNGQLLVFAWTGRVDPLFRVAVWLMAIAGMFKALSLLELVLYRASGRVWMDNLRQVLRIVVLVLLGGFGQSLGFYGILAALAVAEFAGMVVMFFAVKNMLEAFMVKAILTDLARLSVATLMILAAGALLVNPFAPLAVSSRSAAVLQLMGIGVITLAALWPALFFSRSMSAPEGRAILSLFSKRAYGSA